mgnify:CR=1 FL=1
MSRLAHGVVARFNVPFELVVEAVKSIGEASNVYWEVLSSNPRIALFVGEKYFFRTDNSLAATTIVIDRKEYTLVKVVATGGSGRGLNALFDFGASRAYARIVLDKIARRTNAKPEVIAEVDYLDSESAQKLHVA